MVIGCYGDNIYWYKSDIINWFNTISGYELVRAINDFYIKGTIMPFSNNPYLQSSVALF